MKGWQIFVHSVRLVFRNLDHAFRVSAVLYLITVAAQLYAFSTPGVDPQTLTADPQTQTPELGALTNYLLLTLASLFASLWIAVAWHRFVLAEEYPQGWLPRWHGDKLLGYLGRSILIGILIGVAIMITSIPVGMVALAIPQGEVVLIAFMLGLGTYLFFRLGIILPAAAMGKPMKISEAWALTKDESGALVSLAGIAVVAGLVIQVPSLISGGSGIVSLIYGLVTGWFLTIISVSVLTTLYGHLVEGRSID